ncbi:hypothetical protein BKA70DRAFT_466322 [Coprinopsis sp. MPI-PUGE-AT-0042]|nr:hypothetical protein BKA70DRAFT_466322 [Coprinopsis sp. MPI-PUGE-AT-0042]
MSIFGAMAVAHLNPSPRLGLLLSPRTLAARGSRRQLSLLFLIIPTASPLFPLEDGRWRNRGIALPTRSKSSTNKRLHVLIGTFVVSRNLSRVLQAFPTLFLKCLLLMRFLRYLMLTLLRFQSMELIILYEWGRYDLSRRLPCTTYANKTKSGEK